MTDSFRDRLLAYILNDSIPAGMVKSAWSGFTAPGDALAGRLDPSSEEGRARAMEAAGLMFAGSFPAARAVGTAEKVASRSPRLYDPPAKPLRPFEADYPAGAVADDAGRLQFDIEGRPLTAEYVAGRRLAEGSDQSLGPLDVAGIAGRATGTGIRELPPSEIGPGTVGAVTVNRATRQPNAVFISDDLVEPQSSRVAAHEVGHVIDQIAGEIPTKGAKKELRAIYNDLNNPQSHGRPFGPENNKYAGEAVDRELMSEATRAYMADPNYIKTVAPETAARIRAYVNANPKLKDIIQFNSVGALGALGAAGLYDWRQPENSIDRFGDLYRAGRGA